MKLNEIDFNLLSDKELILISLKYKIITKDEVSSLNRKILLDKLKSFLQNKLTNYGQRKRRMSVQGNIQKNSIQSQKNQGPPRPTKERRMSHPITTNEIKQAHKTHELNNIKQESQNQVRHETSSIDPKYDVIGMYPPVKKLIAIGDLHGDLRITLLALKLAEVIPQTSNTNDINSIHWCGGSSWVIQLGDQIDRCRPQDWVQNCIKDFNDVVEDEGSNVIIIKLLLRLDSEARECGGRLLGLLGNHELMNVDKDFRYVSPQEFMEFVPPKDRTKKYTDDGYPLGYYHRKKAFERGSQLSNVYATKKKSIMIVGSYLFVHGGLSIDLVSKYSISEINNVVSKWLQNKCSSVEEDIFDEIFRDDDDMSPFWCRIFGEEDFQGDNTEKCFNELITLINQKNKLLMPVKGMVIAHTPQFMENKYLNSIYDDRLWRIDVGMSRAFGKHDSSCSDNKYRQIQILVIHDNKTFEIRKKPFNSDRHPTINIGNKVSLQNEKMPF